MKLFIERACTNVRITRLWNDLPEVVVTAPSVLLSDKQFGFIKGRSTVLQLLKVLDSWTDTLENGGCIDVVYCDFMKAFDKVPHRRLIGKLQSYGIKGKILDWIAAMLSHRSQRIRVNNSFSSWQEVTSGIPQGSECYL